MTRVAYLGNFLPEHSTENEVRRALETLGVQVVTYQENDPISWNALRFFEPGWFDFVLWTTTHSFNVDVDLRREVLDSVRGRGLMVVGYHLDRWWGLERESQIETHPFFTHTDLVCTADGGREEEWRRAGIRHEWFPPAISARNVGLVEADHERFPFAVVFVGSHRTYHPEWPWRNEMVRLLSKRYRRQGLFGIYPNGPSAIRGNDLSTLYATAKVVVGDSCLTGDAHHYWSDRVPETLGRGGILVHPDVAGLEESFEFGRYLFDYEAENPASMFDAIGAALALSDEERLAARQAGVEIVARGETYEHRMEALLGLVGNGSPRRRVWSFGKGAVFLPREGSTDDVVIDETWRENVYRLDPEWVRDKVVVDIGANVGAVSVWAALHGAADVLAVEPEPGNLEALYENLAQNEIDEEVVTVWPYAVHGGDAEPCWAVLKGAGGGTKVVEWRGGLECPEGATRAVPFARVIQEFDVIDLLKIDIEGGEWPILREPANVSVLSERVRRMVIEFHDHGHGGGLAAEFGEVVALLAEVGKVEILGRPSAGGLIWWEAYR